MKKNKPKPIIKEQFYFNIEEEQEIYKCLCKEKYSKKKISSDKRFSTYQGWKNHIIKKFEWCSRDGLIELSRLFNLLQRNKSTTLTFTQSIFIDIAIVIFTLATEEFLDFLLILNTHKTMATTTYILYFFFIVIAYLSVIVYTLLVMNSISIKNERYQYFLDDIQEILSEMIEIYDRIE